MTLTDATARVYEMLKEPSTNNSHLTSTMVERYLNDGYARFCRETNCLNREDTIAIVSGTAEYALPKDLITIKGIVYKTTIQTKIDGGTPTFTYQYRDITFITEAEAISNFGLAYLKNNYTGPATYAWVSKQSASTSSSVPSIILLPCPTVPAVETIITDVTTEITTTHSLILNIRCFPVATPGTGMYGVLTSGASSFVLRPEVEEAPIFYAVGRIGMTILADDPACVARAQAAMSLWNEACDIQRTQTIYA
jgi:hypothetical protein